MVLCCRNVMQNYSFLAISVHGAFGVKAIQNYGQLKVSPVSMYVARQRVVQGYSLSRRLTCIN